MKKGVLAVLFLLILASFAHAVADADRDGVPDVDAQGNVLDQCPNSATTDVDQFGCSCSQKNCAADDNPCTDDCAMVNGLVACSAYNKKPCDGGFCILGKCVKKEIVKEQVKCVFEKPSQAPSDSAKLDTCYSVRGECSGVDSCVVDVEGNTGEKVEWKSSCGGYAYTVMDGEKEEIKFNCIAKPVCPVASDVFLYQNSGEWSIKFGDGLGEFKDFDGKWDTRIPHIRAASLNKDPLTDFVVYNNSTGIITSAINFNNGYFMLHDTKSELGSDIYVADLNGDALSDVFLYNPHDGAWVSCFYNKQDSFDCSQAQKWSSDWSIYPARFNSDSLDDLLVYNIKTGQYYIMINDGKNNFFYGNTKTLSTQDPPKEQMRFLEPGFSVYQGEFNGDGITDFLFYNSEKNDGNYIVAITRGDNFEQIKGNWDAGFTVNIGNFDGNKKADVFLYRPSDGIWIEAINRYNEISAETNTEGFNFEYYKGSWSPGWSVYLTDLNNDFKSDAVLYNPNSGEWFSGISTKVGDFSYKSGKWLDSQSVIASQSNTLAITGWLPLELGVPAGCGKIGITSSQLGNENAKSSFAMYVKPGTSQGKYAMYLSKELGIKTNELAKLMGNVIKYDENEIVYEHDGKNNAPFMLESSGDGNIRYSSFEGYIVELDEEPLIVKEKKLSEKAQQNEQKIASMSRFNPLRYGYILFSTRVEDVPEKVEAHNEKLKSDKEEVKARISGLLEKPITNEITGRVVSEMAQLKTLGEYEKVFNGFALDATTEEADKIKSVRGVKKVYPNNKVKATLRESVPLINADKVWVLDKDGNKCAETGKDCLTGKGVTIAIIDTGVDYTHPDLGGCFGSGTVSASNSNTQSSSSLGNENYEIQLDIPSYREEYLRHPQKLFSGRKIKIISKKTNSDVASRGGATVFGQTVTLSRAGSARGTSGSQLRIEAAKANYFTLKLPEDAETGSYTIRFTERGQEVSLPIEVEGFSTEEKSQISAQRESQGQETSSFPISRLGCGSCYWESVIAANPQDKNYGYFAGGGASDNLVMTRDGWKSSEILRINNLADPGSRGYRGDPKFAFGPEGRLTLASLFERAQEPISGGIYQEKTARGYPIRLSQTTLVQVPSEIPFQDFWIIFDYPKISIDTNPASPYFNNIYVFANTLTSEQYRRLLTKDSSGNIKEKNLNSGIPFTSTVVGPDGALYAARPNDNHHSKSVIVSNDGGNTFSEYFIYKDYKENQGGITCFPRVSSTSNRGWFAYGGPELTIGKNGRLFAVWGDYKRCIKDSNFEFDSYAYDWDIYVSYSDNKGVDWSAPVRVNDDYQNGDQVFPSIAVDGETVYIAFLDHRNDKNRAQFDVYLAQSIDNGRAFSKNIKINDVSIPNSAGGREPGDYLDMVSLGSDKIFISHPCVDPRTYLATAATDACVSTVSKPLAFEPQRPAQCSDGQDNDNDGFIDMEDKGCSDRFDDNEGDEKTIVEGICKVIGGYDFVNKDNDPMDDQGHGTHVAATAAGNGVLKGVAPDAKIYAYKVLDAQGSGSFNDIISAIELAVDPNNDRDFSDRANIISMSLGADCIFGYDKDCGPDDPVSTAVDNAVNRGVVAVIAAGNSGQYGEKTIGTPGTARKAITVGATDKSSKIAEFSSRGPVDPGNEYLTKPEILAPGVEICAALSSQHQNYFDTKRCLDDKHMSISGTSMATPHIAGAAALLLQANPRWSPEEIKNALLLGSRDLEYGINTQGKGLADVEKSSKKDINVLPGIVNFEKIIDSLPKARIVTIKNNRNQPATVRLRTECNEGALNKNELNLQPGAVGEFSLSIASFPSKDDLTLCNIVVDSGIRYVIPYSLFSASEVTISVDAGNKNSSSDIAITNDKLTFAGYKFDAGKSHSFIVPSGRYIAYAAGDINNPQNTEYLLMESVDVPKNKRISKTLSLSNAKKLKVKGKSFSGADLRMYDWMKAFRVYNKNCHFDYMVSYPSYGDRFVYVSKKPSGNLNADVFFKYDGVPSKAIPDFKDNPYEGSFRWLCAENEDDTR